MREYACSFPSAPSPPPASASFWSSLTPKSSLLSVRFRPFSSAVWATKSGLCAWRALAAGLEGFHLGPMSDTTSRQPRGVYSLIPLILVAPPLTYTM